MFEVISTELTHEIINQSIQPALAAIEPIGLDRCIGRYLAEDAILSEFVPGFNRSTVDGFAVRGNDTSGSSDSIPALLTLVGEIHMGEAADFSLRPGECCAVPTGGAIPKGADAVCMMEYAESLGGDQIAIYKPAAPGANVIRMGEDGKPGDILVSKGSRLTPGMVGTLAAFGITKPKAFKPLHVGIVSTGDELVEPSVVPDPGKIRDVNSPMLQALCLEAGCAANNYGIIRDNREKLGSILNQAVSENDLVLVSGGTSVGLKDALPEVIGSLGEVLVHGIAVKPGKPTIIGKIRKKAVFGLPGNPVAALLIFKEFTQPFILYSYHARITTISKPAKLSRAVSSNHGREEFVLARLDGDLAIPIPSKSGLISTAAKADGYFIIPRDAEGMKQGALVQVKMF